LTRIVMFKAIIKMRDLRHTHPYTHTHARARAPCFSIFARICTNQRAS